MSNKNEVFEYLIDQLRQQVNNSPYKQQCEDLAHEVQSLKNQLNYYSQQIKDLLAERADTDLMWEKCLDNTATKTLKTDEWEKTIHRNAEGHVVGITYGKLPEQYGRRKEDTQECEHEWCAETFYGTRIPPTYCRKCGAIAE